MEFLSYLLGGIGMNNRERQWYEGKYEEHPATCACVECCEKRRLAQIEEDKIRDEQAKMRTGATERIALIKTRTKKDTKA